MAVDKKMLRAGMDALLPFKELYEELEQPLETDRKSEDFDWADWDQHDVTFTVKRGRLREAAKAYELMNTGMLMLRDMEYTANSPMAQKR